MDVELNIYTYTLLAIILGLLFLPLLLHKDPDIHPIALLHQSRPAQIRQQGESAVYRSIYTQSDAPLKSGLGLPGEKAYQTRDGDLRDIWNTYVEKGPGKVLKLEGATVTEVPVEDITKWIHILGSHLTHTSTNKCIAMHLANSIENLVVSFACAFYDLTIILLPYPSNAKTVQSVLSKTQADLLVTAAGVISLNELQGILPLKNVLYVVEKASRALDWNTPPGSRIQTQTFHDVIAGVSTPPVEAPQTVDVQKPAVIITYTPHSSTSLEIIEFSTQNIVAAIGSQLASLPLAERFTPKDIFLPLDSLFLLYPRVLTYAALFSGSLLAVNSVSGATCNIVAASRPISPTIVVASTPALLNLIRHTKGSQMELWHSLITFFQSHTLSSGRLPQGNWLTKFNDYVRPPVGSPHKLRMLFTHELALAAGTQHLSPSDLNDLRQFLAARVVYALCSPRVAGAICAQNPYDYRYERLQKAPKKAKWVQCAHFGPPTPAVEVWLKDSEGYKATDVGGPRGEIWVRGPVVPGKEGRLKGVGLGVVGRWRHDGCLEFVTEWFINLLPKS